jgi:uncharacterized protein
MLLTVEFEWDLEKEVQNIQKHQVNFVEAMESFMDPHGLQLVDIKHSARERRSYWVGRISTGRIITTRFTKRGSKIRSSARPNGESFGDSIMKQPNLSHLRIDPVSTRKMRTALSKKDRITITVNLNTGSLRCLQRPRNQA